MAALALVLCLSVPAVSRAQTDGTQARRALERPHIYLNQKRLTRMIQLATPENLNWQRLKRWSSLADRDEAESMDGPGLAMAWLLGREQDPRLGPRLARLVVTAVMRAVSGQHINDIYEVSGLVSDVALSLDWAWPAFSPEQRHQTAKWLVDTALEYKDQGLGCFDTASAAALKMTLLAGLAAEGLDPRAESLIELALEQRFNQGILPCLLGAGKGGGWFEDSVAGARAGLDILEFAAALKIAKGRDIFSRAPWFQDRLTYLIFDLLPGVAMSPYGPYRRVSPGGDQVLDPLDAADLVRLQMLLLSYMRPDDRSAGFARTLLRDRRSPGVLAGYRLAHELLWFQPDMPLSPLSSAPLAMVAHDLGRGFSRSDWSGLGTWLKFSCGPHFALGQHLDATSLILYRRGMLLSVGGGYDGPGTPHALNYAVRSLAHNTIIIRDPQEYSWYDMGAGQKPKGRYANDGGQRSWAIFHADGEPQKQAPWTASGWEKGRAPWSKLTRIYQVAGIKGMAQEPRYTYMYGDASRAYQGSSNKAQRVVRHVFHLRSGGPQDPLSAEAVVVVDDVVLNNRSARVSFVSHFERRPTAFSQIDETGPGRFEGVGSRLRVRFDNSRLDLVCVVPARPHFKIIGGQGKAGSWVNGKNYPPAPPVRERAPWRAEFAAQTKEGPERVMAHVLFPADSDDSPPPEVELLNADGDQTVAMIIKDRYWPRVVALHTGEPSLETRLTYQYRGGRQRHLVAGLLPDHNYQIEVLAGQVVITPGKVLGIKSSPAGSLSFLVAPGLEKK